VVHAQQAAEAGHAVDHADFYGLAGELVDTLAAVGSLARLLARQVAGYAAEADAAGLVVYDDSRFTTHPVDPRVRLGAAVVELERLAGAAGTATGAANGFWSAIGHIGVEDTDPA
jgi:hypothetical protein